MIVDADYFSNYQNSATKRSQKVSESVVVLTAHIHAATLQTVE